MLKWVDRDTFKIDSQLCMYNYNNVISIGVYSYQSDNKTKIVMKTCTGNEIILASCATSNAEKVKNFENDFIEFYKSRPGNNESNKINVK